MPLERQKNWCGLIDKNNFINLCDMDDAELAVMMQIKLYKVFHRMDERGGSSGSILYQTIEALERAFSQGMPDFIERGLSERIDLRDYQRAFQYFITYFENENLRKTSRSTSFHIAAGSGKTVIMAV